VFVYTTLPSEPAAEALAHILVRERLAACVNIYPGMRAIFEWQGKIEEARETGMFIKTRRELTDQVMETVRRNHPYKVPALLVIPIIRGNTEYLAWLNANTRS
jgi:periplasmic divalent cation tolerance protein